MRTSILHSPLQLAHDVLAREAVQEGLGIDGLEGRHLKQIYLYIKKRKAQRTNETSQKFKSSFEKFKRTPIENFPYSNPNKKCSQVHHLSYF